MRKEAKPMKALAKVRIKELRTLLTMVNREAESIRDIDPELKYELKQVTQDINQADNILHSLLTEK